MIRRLEFWQLVINQWCIKRRPGPLGVAQSPLFLDIAVIGWHLWSMAKAFSVASWNVEHFSQKRDAETVLQFLRDQKPDVFAIYEVKGKAVFDIIADEFPGYQCHITEGRQTMQILLGVKKGFTAIFTQRTEFKSGNTYLRPGALLTLKIDGAYYSTLFLHTKSSSAPVGLGLRDDMFTRAVKFKRVLDKQANKQFGLERANYLFLGDLNTMGMKYPFDKSINPETELRALDRMAARRDLRRLRKSAPFTWSNGTGSRYPESDLDHVVASEHLKFKMFGGAEVDVRGWPEKDSQAGRDSWIETYSDHACLYFEVQKV